MSESSIKGVMDSTIDKVRAMADADTIIGKSIFLPNDITIIPVSKVSFGFTSGGSDFTGKNNSPSFAGGGGAAMSIAPTAFIVIKGSDVRMMQITNKPDAADKAISMMPELIDKVTSLFKKDDNKSGEKKVTDIDEVK